MSAREGDIGVCIWFGAPIMHRMSGLYLAWHWHDVCVHVHLRIHSKTVESCCLLLRLHALVSVKNRVDLLACSVRAMRCNVLLCCAILRPFMCDFSHVDRRCDHVSILCN